MSRIPTVERPNGSATPPRPACAPGHASDGAGRDEWARLLDRWDVAHGSSSERALATAVLLDAARFPTAVRRVAAIILTTFGPATADG